MYQVGILGNCCTHGVGIVSSLNAREDIDIIAGYESEPRRAYELSNVLVFALAGSWGFLHIPRNYPFQIYNIGTIMSSAL